MLDQLSAQFELDFGVTLTGSFMPHGTSASKMGRGSFQAAPEAWPQNETQPSGGGVADMLSHANFSRCTLPYALITTLNTFLD